jgi:phosphohistidine phosphatase SixA
MKPSSALPAASLLTAALASSAVAAPELVILVRHAERASQPPDDPGLTPAGEQRARALAQALAGAEVNVILTTQFRRTRETAAPLAQALGIPPQVIDTSTGHVQAVAGVVRAQTGVVLVIGHSNTVPAILAALGGPQLPDLCETSFHHIFLLRPGAGWMQLSYGAPSEPPAAGCL